MSETESTRHGRRKDAWSRAQLGLPLSMKEQQALAELLVEMKAAWRKTGKYNAKKATRIVRALQGSGYYEAMKRIEEEAHGRVES